jgi:hypothetical protein
MTAKKELRRDLYKCSIRGDVANVELRYEILTNPDRERLLRFSCVDCTRCGVGTKLNAWETKLDWVKCNHPLSPKG